jgi:hypothetical protein
MDTGTLDAGLATTTNTATAVTAPSQPTPAPSPAARPSSWEDAFAQTEATAEQAAPTTDEVTDGDAPTIAEPPTPEIAQAATPDKEGPVPFKAHKTALENARTKAKEEALQTFQQQHGEDLQLAQAWRTDPIATFMWAADQIRSRPDLAPQLASLAGKQLAAQKGKQPQPQVEAEPEADLQMQDGTLLYSDKQLKKWHQWNAKQQDTRLAEQFKPLMQLQQGIQQLQQHDTQTQEFLQQAEPLMTELQQMPGFKDHLSEIATKQDELFRQHGGNPVPLWYRAYREVVPPKLQAQQQQTVQQQQQQLSASAVAKAIGRTDNPAATVPVPPRRPKSFDEAFEQAFDGFTG